MIHAAAACTSPCPFHSPSDHRMTEWPTNLRTSGLVERTCPHGIGHPDPDSLAWLETRGHQALGIHGCDGCCAAPFTRPSRTSRIVLAWRRLTRRGSL